MLFGGFGIWGYELGFGFGWRIVGLGVGLGGVAVGFCLWVGFGVGVVIEFWVGWVLAGGWVGII